MRGRVKSTVAEERQASTRGRLARLCGIVVVLATLAALISLGTWQMQRLAWKEGLLTAIAERRSKPPVDLAAIEALVAEGGDIEYRTVTVSGRYLNNRERHFFATHQGRTGYYIYTPLELSDGSFVFINRGFVPFDAKEPETRKAGQLTGAQTVNGLARARLAEKPSWVVPENDLKKNIFYWKDLDVMAQTDGLPAGKVLPFFIDADATQIPGTLPVGGVTQFELPNNHLQYAVTWYGLAGALVVISGVFVFRRKTQGQ
ncbi:cytochrome c oxidase assembly protein [Rhizobium sp. 58]|nr:cytochrome c oxidase assembly protein [Rhizobium sp. 58]